MRLHCGSQRFECGVIGGRRGPLCEPFQLPPVPGLGQLTKNVTCLTLLVSAATGIMHKISS
jgi:hypothetical protein